MCEYILSKHDFVCVFAFALISVSTAADLCVIILSELHSYNSNTSVSYDVISDVLTFTCDDNYLFGDDASASASYSCGSCADTELLTSVISREFGCKCKYMYIIRGPPKHPSFEFRVTHLAMRMLSTKLVCVIAHCSTDAQCPMYDEFPHTTAQVYDDGAMMSSPAPESTSTWPTSVNLVL